MSASFDRQVVDWIHEGPEQGPRESLERALAATRGVSQRPGWTFLERWLPVQLTMQRVVIPRAVYLMLLAVLLAVVFVVAAIIGAPKELPRPFGPAGNGLVAYDAGGTIYVAKSDGTDARPIEGGLGWNISPTYSPDGTKLAFWSAKSEGSPTDALFVVDVLRGGKPIEVSGEFRTAGRLDIPISWSPDGRSIAYISGIPRQIVIASTDGSGVRPLRNVTKIEDAPSQPVYSPDGQWLAYRSDAGPDARLLVVRSDGSAAPSIVRTSDRETDSFTSLWWATDSRRLVVHRLAVVEIVDLDGVVTPVSLEGEYAVDPSWSPDSSHIAYGIEVDGERHVVVVAPDGTGRRDLGPVGGCVLSWSPDSTYLFGYTTDCFSSKLTRIPVDDPSAAITFELPGDIAGSASWQRIAVEH
jgi:hypothetical protein